MSTAGHRMRVCILGSTGSVGTSTLDVLSRHIDRFEVFALTAHHRVDELLAQCLVWQPKFAVLPEPAQAQALQVRLREAGSATAVLVGRPILYALAVGGEQGVFDALRMLDDEVRLAMALCGVVSLPPPRQLVTPKGHIALSPQSRL